MSINNKENAFLFINRDVTNFQSRDHLKIANSHARRAQHHKEWKHTKLRSSVSKTYFSWRYRPNPTPLKTRPPTGNSVSVVYEDSTVSDEQTRRPGAQHSIPIDRLECDASEAKSPWELPPNNVTAQETRFLTCSWHSQLDNFDADAQCSIPPEQHLPNLEPSPRNILTQSSIEYDCRGLDNQASTEAACIIQDGFSGIRPGQMYPDPPSQSSLHHQQDREDTDDLFSQMIDHASKFLEVDHFTPHPPIRRSTSPTNEIYAEVASPDNGIYHLDDARVPFVWPECTGRQRPRSMEVCVLHGHHCFLLCQ